MKGKALVSSLLAFALTVSMVTPALAAGNATDVTLTVETDETPSTVSVKVPAVIPLHMDKQGVVSVEGDLKIENLSQESGVSVTGITVSGKSGWQVVDYSYDASAEPLNTEKIGMSFNGDPTTAGGSVTLTDGSWNISAYGQLPLVVDAKVPKRDAAPEQSSIAAVNWSFKVDDGGVVPPDESSAISNDWDGGSKMLTGGVRPVTFSWDSTAEDASIVSVSAADDSVVSVASAMAKMPYNSSATYNVTAKAKGTTKVTATLSTGETSEFTVEVCEVKAEGGGDITINVPGTGLKPGDKPGDITIDIPVTGPDGDTTITVKPEIPEDTTLNPGDNEIEVDVTVDGVTIHITIIIKVESDNPSDGLNQSVEEAQAMGFTFSPYEDGLQIDSFENKQFKSEINVPEQIGEFKVLSIGDNVFNGQSNLTKITLPSTVVNVNQSAFRNCENLKYINIPESCTKFGYAALSGAGAKDGVLDIQSVFLVENDYTYNTVDEYSNLAWNGSTVKLPEGITKIGDYSLSGYMAGAPNVKSIVIPGTVTSVGEGAFSGWTSLSEVDFGNASTFGDKAFYGCTSLCLDSGTSTRLLESDVGNASFHNLKAIDFEKSKYIYADTSPFSAETVTVDGYRLVALTKSNKSEYGLDSVSSIDFTQPIASKTTGEEVYFGSIGNSTFATGDTLNTVIIGGTVRNIGTKAFESRKALTSLTLVDGVRSIGANAFWGSGITEVSLPDTLSSPVGTNAFGYCKSLSVVEFGNGSFDKIEANAFENCISLATVNIPERILTVGESAFSDCTSLTSVSVGSAQILESAFNDCTSLSSVELGDRLNTIGDYAFSGCDALSQVVLPDSVSSLGENAFYSCNMLKTVKLPSTISYIAKGAFSGCESLTDIEIPDSVHYIWEYAFSGCIGLDGITIPSTVTNIHDNAFKNIPHIYYSGSASGSPWGALAIN